MKNGSAGVRWSEEELEFKAKSLFKTKKYSNRKTSILNRFFRTIRDYGGCLENLADITVDKFGEAKQ